MSKATENEAIRIILRDAIIKPTPGRAIRRNHHASLAMTLRLSLNVIAVNYYRCLCGLCARWTHPGCGFLIRKFANAPQDEKWAQLNALKHKSKSSNPHDVEVV